MFSGIVETQASVMSTRTRDQVLEIELSKPSHFTDIKIGDSMAVNGICLTVEKSDDKSIHFVLGPETLKVTGWNSQNLVDQSMNIERSLSYQERVHGHLVYGHVDSVGTVKKVLPLGESLELWIEFSSELSPYLWVKGSVAINGVSLVINQIQAEQLSVCLIPETLRQTNLGDVEVGESLMLEIDNMARAMVRQWQEGVKL